jgi:hypothetical protein
MINFTITIADADEHQAIDSYLTWIWCNIHCAWGLIDLRDKIKDYPRKATTYPLLVTIEAMEEYDFTYNTKDKDFSGLLHTDIACVVPLAYWLQTNYNLHGKSDVTARLWSAYNE